MRPGSAPNPIAQRQSLNDVLLYGILAFGILKTGLSMLSASDKRPALHCLTLQSDMLPLAAGVFTFAMLYNNLSPKQIKLLMLTAIVMCIHFAIQANGCFNSPIPGKSHPISQP